MSPHTAKWCSPQNTLMWARGRLSNMYRSNYIQLLFSVPSIEIMAATRIVSVFCFRLLLSRSSTLCTREVTRSPLRLKPPFFFQLAESPPSGRLLLARTHNISPDFFCVYISTLPSLCLSNWIHFILTYLVTTLFNLQPSSRNLASQDVCYVWGSALLCPESPRRRSSSVVHLSEKRTLIACSCWTSAYWYIDVLSYYSTSIGVCSLVIVRTKNLVRSIWYFLGWGAPWIAGVDCLMKKKKVLRA